MSMLEIKSVRKSFFTYAKPGLQAGIFHRPGARKPTSELKVLQGVDLTVEKGDVVAILGPSGSGKTTLLRCLNFLETADVGQLTFDGETFDLARASRADIARLRKKTALPTGRTTTPASFPAASSSAWPSPGRWHPTRRSSISTSPPLPSTRS